MKSINALNRHIAVVRKASNSHVLSVFSNNRTYLVGFPNLDIAHRVSRRIDANVPMILTRKYAEDVALDVKKSLMEMNIPIANVADSITIDVEASLEVPKSHVISVSKERMLVDNMDVFEFMMMPFTHNVGVVMPSELVLDNEDKYIFTCSVIDPTTDTKTFTKFLKL
jgi:hypothetical protein